MYWTRESQYEIHLINQIINRGLYPTINQKMKTFLKSLLISSLSIFAIVSFIRFDVNIADWGESGRGSYLFFTLLFSFVSATIMESEKSSK